jgi:excisionase family DNA binding protein
VKPSENAAPVPATSRHAHKPVDSSIEPRLLSPEQAATYLGLGSRWAVRRLMVNGELQVVRLAGKLRFDREDLDRLISARKSSPAAPACHPHELEAPPRVTAVERVTAVAPDSLAPLRRRGARTVTER